LTAPYMSHELDNERRMKEIEEKRSYTILEFSFD
jgi:hypothetical protein